MTDDCTYTLGPDCTLFHADCRDALKALPDNCVDAVCTDPPYALVSVVKRFGGPNAAPARGNELYQRQSAGFMGKNWDNGEVAFDPGFWAEVLRVLKPGGHVVAMGGTRTYHHLAMAIETAGFEIRDSLSWIYGSGFPKSQNVSAFIDKINAEVGREYRFTAWMRSTGLKAAELDNITKTRMGGHYLTTASQPAIPTRALFDMIKVHLNSDIPEWVETLIDRVEAEREVIGTREKLESWNYKGNNVYQTGGDQQLVTLDITAPATEAAKEWDGWGTALKPAHEPIVLARKPLSESTVAANVLKWRTGALNIGACRVSHSDPLKTTERTAPRYSGRVMNSGERGGEQSVIASADPAGRWPANLCHDGSAEVVEAFPTLGKASGVGRALRERGKRPGGFGNVGHDSGDDAPNAAVYSDEGSAARFFYSAKASKLDRAGSKHPTVKPVSLMSWLVKLITPPGGVVLDPFAGSGTTGQAALANGFKCLLVEREAEYVADICRRLSPSPSIMPEDAEKLAAIAAEFPDMEFTVRAGPARRG